MENETEDLLVSPRGLSSFQVLSPEPQRGRDDDVGQMERARGSLTERRALMHNGSSDL